ncbi:MAG TPA: ATP-binding protein [Longimicrobiales bacterium]
MSPELMETVESGLREELAQQMRELQRLRHELEQKDEQLRQAQKMEVLGNFAGGIAHDFNNIVLTISGYASMALQAWPNGHPGREDIEEVMRSAEQAQALTRQLLAFARKERPQIRPVRLGDVIRDVDQLLRKSAGPGVGLRFRVQPDAAPVRADPNQIQQVLLNLVVNARDAMPEGGEVRIGVDDVTLVEALDSVDGPVHPGDWVRLTVEDTGAGMSKETRERALEPFFTTKPAGRGTGLGLAICHDILSRAGAHMRLTSAPGRGTTFDIYFPRRAEQPVRHRRT